MRFKQLLFLILASYWLATILVFGNFDVSRFLDLESMVYLLFFSITAVFFVNSSSRIALPVFFIIADYVFMKYLLGGLKLGLLSEYGDKLWVFESYSWAGVSEINVWLRHGLLSTICLCAGIYCLDHSIGKKTRRTLADKETELIGLNINHLFLVLLALLIYCIWVFSRTGYGAISGIESDAMINLYGVLSMEPVVLISLAILIFQRGALSKQQTTLFIALLVFYMLFRVFSGSRAFLMYPLIYFTILYSYCKGNFGIRRKAIFAVLIAISINVVFYPIALGFKRLITGGWQNVNSINLTLLLDDIFITEPPKDFFSNFDGSMEIVDRLSDMGAPLRIINGTNVIPLEQNFTFPKVIKRAINDMVPGDVFTDVIGTQQVWHNTYFGQDAVYGGEEFGIYGIYYIHFGYLGSLISLFLTGFIGSILWAKLLSVQLPYRPILLTYTLSGVFNFMHNPMLEVWFIGSVFRPMLTLLLIYCVLVGMGGAGRIVRFSLAK